METKPNTAHTPGPWTVEEWAIGERKQYTLVVRTESDCIAYANALWNPDERRAECEANARLIAAAPRMHDYIAKRAAAGDAEAATILGAIHGNA